ncbi:MAG: hypothetical protein KA181_08580 [Xylophilus sp.]|jgi:flagellar biosynthesis GTPase FlhF|nr:hypothetical protein [Xylophilus sp.]
MYSNDDDRRRDEQHRLEEQRRDEQRRRDDNAAYERKQQEQRENAQAWARKEAQARESHAQEQQRLAGNERHDRDWDEWRKQQAARSGAYAAPASAPSAPQGTSSSGRSGDDGLGGLVGLAILLLLLAMPPLLAFAVLEEFIQKFPRYAVDPSFSGQVAGFFVQALGVEWAKTLHKWIETSFRHKDYWHMFLYGAGVWVILACGLSLIRQMFRVHVMAGLVTMLALLGPMVLVMYVSWHFSR